MDLSRHTKHPKNPGATMKILYGVQGEGMGHAIRSGVCIEYLSKHHTVLACASGRAHTYLSGLGIDTKEIGGFHIVYDNNAVLNRKTLMSNLKESPKQIHKSKILLHLIDSYKPDIIISDFEPFTAYAAILRNVPLLSLDNQHVQTLTHIEKIPNAADRLIAALIIRMVIPRASHYVITTLIDAYPKKKCVSIVPPLVRKAFFTLPIKDKNYYFVYQTSFTQNHLLEELQKMPFTFVVYGFNQNKNIGNIQLRTFNEKTLFKDLAECTGVITGGGFSLISEALTLKKPIYCIPVKKQYEQMLNAHIIEKEGWGMYKQKFDIPSFTTFTKNIGSYKKNLKKHKAIHPQKIVKDIEKILKKII